MPSFPRRACVCLFTPENQLLRRPGPRHFLRHAPYSTTSTPSPSTTERSIPSRPPATAATTKQDAATGAACAPSPAPPPPPPPPPASPASALASPVASPSPSASTSAVLPTPTRLRHLMRLVPNPVAIVTSTNPFHNDQQQQQQQCQQPTTTTTSSSPFKGMTISSFNTLTLAPVPIVFFNINTPSETYNAIAASGRFLVHLLAASPRAARLARVFAGGNANATANACGGGGGNGNEPFFRFLSSSRSVAGYHEHQHQHQQPQQRAPVVEDGEPPLLSLGGKRGENDTVEKREADPGVLNNNDADADFRIVLECRFLPQSIQVGTHVIILGEVARIISPEAEPEHEHEHEAKKNNNNNNHHQGHNTTNGSNNNINAGGASPQRTPGLHRHRHQPEELCMAYADTRFWRLGADIVDDGQKSGSR